MPARIWPSILVPSDEEWNANVATSVSNGRGFGNTEQPVVGPSGYVTASLTVPCKTQDKVLAMRALLAGLDGRAGTVIVGPNETARAPWFRDPYTDGAITYATGDRDKAVSSAYGTNDDTRSDLDIRTTGAAALNATFVNARVYRGSPIQPGMYFSIGATAPRLHVVTDVDAATVGGAQAVGLTIRPWLRDDLAADTAIEFGRPRCLMRLAGDDTGRMLLELARYATVTLDLVEA